MARRPEVIGEATKKLPMEFRESHPSVPWRDIAGALVDGVDLHPACMKPPCLEEARFVERALG